MRWSSYLYYLKPTAERSGWLRPERLLGEKGIPKGSKAGREMFARLMERRRAAEATARCGRVRRGWFVGSEQERTMSLKWIAQRLHTGSWTYVSNLLHGTPGAPHPTQQWLPLCQ